MIILATIITLVVYVLLLVGLFRDGTVKGRHLNSKRLIVGGGLILPVVVLLTLSGLTVATLRSDPEGAVGDVNITVVGHQYWWEVRYPSAGVVTANEIHVPAGHEIRFTLESVDVIHGFWVPALGGKVDMIPGHVNHVTLKADAIGSYRGQCTILCGLQHAHMAFVVIAQSEHDYQKWLRGQERPAATPTGTEARVGATTFASQSCAGCHEIRGTSATGHRGPDLTHFASRSTIGALTIPNDTEHLSRWVIDAPSLKPGILMPPVPLSPSQKRAIVAYLRELH